MKRVIFFLFLFGIGVSSANNLLQNNIQLKKHTQNIIYQNYLESDFKGFQMFGFCFDTFFADNLFYELSISGVIGSSEPRSGFGVALYGIGYYLPLNETINLTPTILVGAGGGGHLGVNGGLAYQTKLGITYQLFDKGALLFEYSYMNFPTGTFSSAIITLGLSITSFEYIL